MWNENRGQASDLQKLNVEIAMDSGVGFAKFRGGVEWRGWATKGNRPQITPLLRDDEKGRPSLGGPVRWLDSADPYIRSALLSEVVSANIETIVHPACLTNPERRVQPSDG